MIARDAKKLLEWVMQPHTDLACDLFKLVKSKSSDDPTSRYQMAGMVVFLAGLDKTLSLVVNLLYINGLFTWNEVAPRQPEPRPGYLEGGRGMEKKLGLLKSRGLDLQIVKGFVESRNYFTHNVVIDASYKQYWSEDDHFDIFPKGPDIGYSGFPIYALDEEHLRNLSDELIQKTAKFLEDKNWYNGIEKLRTELRQLPKNPIDLSKIEGDEFEFDQKVEQIIDELNEEYIGVGFQKLLCATAT